MGEIERSAVRCVLAGDDEVLNALEESAEALDLLGGDSEVALAAGLLRLGRGGERGAKDGERLKTQ